MQKCGQKCQVYSRVTGYYSNVDNFNKGKQQEFKERASQKVTLSKEKERASQKVTLSKETDCRHNEKHD